MKKLQLTLLLLCCLPLMALTDFDLGFLSAEPSAINLAMGGKAVSCVNIWHNSPLTSYSNPAMAAYHTGISYGLGKRELRQGEDLGMDYYASLVNINLGDISLTLPSYKLGDMSGLQIDYQPVSHYDSEGNLMFQYKLYEEAGVYGLAFDALDVVQSGLIPDCIYDNMSVAVGVNYLDISSHIIASPERYNSRNVDSYDFGTAVRYSYDWSDATEFELVGAYSRNNVFDSNITIVGPYKTSIWEGESKGIAVAMHGKAEAILKRITAPERMFFDNLYSIRFMNSALSEREGDSRGWGVEVGLMDTFFFRKGRYFGYEDGPRGESVGYGINLHFRDSISLSWNYAKYPGIEDDADQEAEDINLSFDFMALAKHLIR